jgi:RNA polymerase sigma factor (sigma-70 family)
MHDQTLLPHLFRTEYRNIVSVLCYHFGIDHIEVAEDLVSDTFLSATEVWSIQGIPDNPKAWLYQVAKNKTKTYLTRNALFEKRLAPEIKHISDATIEIDLSVKNISDSQLAMIFTICNPCNSVEAQIALALNLLCGFGSQEIADAFLTNKEVVYKRLNRAKEKLKETNIKIEQPTLQEINDRLDTVLKTLYLLFSEGYYSTSQNTILRKDLCSEAMRLISLLIDNPATNTPAVNALFALMCFHSSRFEARINQNGEAILYQDQNDSLWDQQLVETGIAYLNRASTGSVISKYHLEAGIAYWHTQKEDTVEKWENILALYNNLLALEYSPIAALNRTFALSKTNGKKDAIMEALKLNLTDNPFYYSLLGNLYSDIDNGKAISYFEAALKYSQSLTDKLTISRNIARLSADTENTKK